MELLKPKVFVPFDKWVESIMGAGTKLWQGDEPKGLTVAEILSHQDSRMLLSPTDVQIEEAHRFIQGEQWDPIIRDARGRRPTLILNYIDRLLTDALVASREQGYKVSGEDAALVMYVIVTRNRDHQRMYNYLYSSYIEEMAFCLHPPVMIMSAEEAAAMKGVPA